MERLLKLTERAHDLLIEVEPGADLSDVATIEDALEYHLCNGWALIQPEEVGALTSGLLISQDYARDDHGTLTDVGAVYWDADYQVYDALETLRDKGRVTFCKG